MKKFVPLALLSAAACQPQATPDTAPAVAHATPPVATKWRLPSPFKATDTLTAAMRQLLSRYDLSPLWQGAVKARGSSPVLEGFFGPDHYRFELALLEARRDAQNPALYQVRGKCHYRKNIRPFTGTLVIREISAAELPYEFGNDADAPNQSEAVSSDSAAAIYEQKLRRAHPTEVRAELRIREEHTANSGELVGEATLLFYTNSHNRLAYLLAPIRGTDSFTNAGYHLCDMYF